jgi:hypothetical protein
MAFAADTEFAGVRRLAVTRTRVDLLAVAACIGLALIAQAALPSLPSYDPFSWIIWGHELAHQLIGPHLQFVIHGGPSWKPLPVLFTTIFGFIGHDQLALWIIFSRALGLYGLYLAFVNGARLGATERWRASGPLAGMLAAVAVVLMLDWIHFMLRATSEPLTVTAALAWLDWHLRGRRLLGLSAGTALALMRPESTFLVGPYALWCLWRLPGVWRRLIVIGELVLIPAAWLLPPALAAGTPFMSANQARDFRGNRGLDVYTIALQRADHLLVWPVIAAALVMTLIALRERDWPIVGLACICVAYLGVVELMTIHGYPGLTRFLLPAGALMCVLAGAGVVRLAALVPGSVAPGVVTVILVAIAMPWSYARIGDWRSEHRQATEAVHAYDAMVLAADRLRGVRRMWPCPHSVVAINHTVQPSLAWALDVPLNRVHPVTDRVSSVRHPLLAIFAPRTVVVGGAPRRLERGLHRRLVLRDGMWRVWRITRRHDRQIDACVGGTRIGHAPRDHRAHGHAARHHSGHAAPHHSGHTARPTSRRAGTRRAHHHRLSASARADRHRRPHARPARERPSRPHATGHHASRPNRRRRMPLRRSRRRG